MFKQSSRSTWLNPASLAVLLAANSSAMAGPIKITNHSKEPWCLRLGQTVEVLAQGQPASISEDGQLFYCLQPGATCILKVEGAKGGAVATEVGLVDKTGTENGRIKIHSQAGSKPGSWFQGLSGLFTRSKPEVVVSLPPKTDGPKVAEDTEDTESYRINSDAWGDWY